MFYGFIDSILPSKKLKIARFQYFIFFKMKLTIFQDNPRITKLPSSYMQDTISSLLPFFPLIISDYVLAIVIDFKN
jgi:hypothetical protein